MRLRLLEIELDTADPEASKRFYGDQLGLKMSVDEVGIKVFGTGIEDLDIIQSAHFPGRVSMSFYAEDIQQCIKELNDRGVQIIETFGHPVSAIVLQDPDGNRIEIKKEHG